MAYYHAREKGYTMMAQQAEGKNYLVRAVVALVADADERTRAHVGVADYALAIAWVFSTAADKNIRAFTVQKGRCYITL